MSNRRLPIYLLVDTATSMDGEAIEKTKSAIQGFIHDLVADPCTLEIVWLSVITFGTEAKQIVPLTPVCDFVMPEFVIGGVSKLDSALSLLCEMREREVVRATAERKGDWRPYFFCFTDGKMVVESIRRGIDDVKSKRWEKCGFFLVGDDANTAEVRNIDKEHVFLLEQSLPFKEFIMGLQPCKPIISCPVAVHAADEKSGIAHESIPAPPPVFGGDNEMANTSEEISWQFGCSGEWPYKNKNKEN